MAPVTPTPSQEAVTVAQLITSHASRSRRKRVPDFLSEVPDRLVARRHSKNRETPIMLYNSLKIYVRVELVINLIISSILEYVFPTTVFWR